ncbi:SRPBCC domain-containing protein [Streptomyces scabiei]|nr:MULTISPECIES: SRPBCC domain-containing protein [Streptomyces]MBP5867130.1 SRPBCC domain-containing protein [Streptomyces sp. LBUM 1485]MBP5917097.1 SRPBCC domain-containing protein [Streptomyces sp. LBUM 1486]MDX2575666.1 SRPBCC domain-containing protein [Streptomyces scabiei]MDX2651919.1 SRPBCC domain-containing protein [Streptomyces scabiei]MDX2719445.1 SRPBCC domain-containing protein [Streptomyces scabiei]
MRRISSAVHIHSTVDQVWSVLTDFERFHEWNPFLVEASGRAEPGARLTLRFRLPDGGREMVFTPTVLESEPGRLLRWRGRFGVPGVFDGVHSFELIAREGGTDVVQTERFSGLLVPFAGSVITPSEQGFRHLTDALKVRVESSHVPARDLDRRQRLQGEL